MPQLRSFTGFASTPDVGGAFIGGANIAARAAQASQELALGREKIAAEMAQSNMALAAKQEALQAQSLRDQQELQIKKAYQDADLGMKQREIDNAESLIQLKTQEAARRFQAQQMYQQEAASMVASGKTSEEAFAQSAMKWGPQLDLPGSVYSKAFESPESDSPPLGAMLPIEGVDPSEARQFVSGKGSRQLVPTQPSAGDAPLPEGYERWGNRIVVKREPAELKEYKQERTRLQRQQDADSTGNMMYGRMISDPDAKIGKAVKYAAEQYQKREARLGELNDKIKSFSPDQRRPSIPSGFKEGQRIRNKRTGKLYVIKNGEPVEINED